jgi:hypothetical protein
MSKLSLLEKNAYLTIYLNEGVISANLAYSHYEIGRSYVLNDISQYDQNRDELSTPYFWEQYLDGLEKLWKWGLLTDRGANESFRSTVPFADEGNGVCSINIILWNSFKNLPEIIAAIRSISSRINVELIDHKKTADRVAGAADRFGYSDVLYVDLNPRLFRYSRMQKVSNRNKMVNIKAPSWSNKIGKVSWDSIEALIDLFDSSKFKAFLSIEGREFNRNLWANFVTKPTLKLLEGPVLDLLRSYVTAQLFSSYNDRQELFKDIGISDLGSKDLDEGSTDLSKTRLIIVSGLLAKILPVKYLAISLLDGLQLRGGFDLFIDYDDRFVSYGDQYALGINATSYIMTRDELGFNPIRIYCAEVPGSGSENRVVFDGQNIITQENQKDTNMNSQMQAVYALSGQIYSYDIPIAKKNYVTGKFLKGAYVDGIGEEIVLTSEKHGLRYKNLMIDARFKPTIYGPNFNVNRSNLNRWLS